MLKYIATNTLRTTEACSHSLLRSSVRTISSKPPKDSDDISGQTKKRISVYPKSKSTKSNPSTTTTSSHPSTLQTFKSTRSHKGDERSKGSLRSKRQARKIEDPQQTSNNVNNVKPKPSFIAFTDFPKAPESILNKSSKELYTSIDLPELYEQAGSFHNKQKHYVDFAIDDKYIKSKVRNQITEKDRSVVAELDKFAKSEEDEESNQTQLKLIKLYYDQSTNTLQPLPEHYLKKSLSGMINMNKSLDDIDDEYLWDLIPREKLFGVSPFEPKIEPDGFKKWEQMMIEKERKAQSIKEEDTRQYRDFEQSLSDSKSFYKKAGSRRKVDRKLVKRYKKLKEEGKIPTDLKKNGSTAGKDSFSINDVFDDFL